MASSASMNNRLVPICTLNLSVCEHISVYKYTGGHFHRYFTLPKSQLRLYQGLKKPSKADDVTHSHKRPGFETKGGRRKASRHAYWAYSSRPVSCFPIMALALLLPFALLPDPVRTPGPVQPKKFGRWRKN